MKRYFLFLSPILLATIILLLPTPEKLDVHAWRFFAIFSGAILALILEKLPGAVIGLTAVMIIAIFSPWFLFSLQQQTNPNFNIPFSSFKWAISGFSNSTVWLIFSAFIFAYGYEKTNLGKRLSLILVKFLGKRTITLGYAILFSDLLLAPFIPSNTARTGGIIYPIISHLPPLYGSKPNDKSSKIIGSYLMWISLSASCITSSMFLSAMAPNLLSLELIKNFFNINITWSTWFISFLPVGILFLLFLPYIVYWIYPPLIKCNNDVPKWASSELHKLGKLSSKEIILMGLLSYALICWIFFSTFIDSATVGLMVVVLMLLTDIINWNDIITNKSAWNIFFWFSTLITLSSGLSDVGFIDWLKIYGSSYLSNHYSHITYTILLVCIYYIMHYLFASATAHAITLLPAILSIGSSIPCINLKILSILLCTSLGLMGAMTPYASGPSPIFYNSGYILTKDYWKLGCIFSIIFLLTFLIIEYPWLLILNKYNFII